MGADVLDDCAFCQDEVAKLRAFLEEVEQRAAPEHRREHATVVAFKAAIDRLLEEQNGSIKACASIMVKVLYRRARNEDVDIAWEHLVPLRQKPTQELTEEDLADLKDIPQA